MISTPLLCLFFLLQATCAPLDSETGHQEETARAAEGSNANPLETFQQIFNPTSSADGRPMAVLGTFQTLFMPMPSLQQSQAIANGMNTLGGVFKPLVDGVQNIQQQAGGG